MILHFKHLKSHFGDLLVLVCILAKMTPGPIDFCQSFEIPPPPLEIPPPLKNHDFYCGKSGHFAGGGQITVEKCLKSAKKRPGWQNGQIRRNAPLNTKKSFFTTPPGLRAVRVTGWGRGPTKFFFRQLR